MFRPFRKLLIKMRDYLRTLNKNELFQLEKLLCTNEEINLAAQAISGESTSHCCEEKSKIVLQTSTSNDFTNSNMTIVPKSYSSKCNETTMGKKNHNFYEIKTECERASNDWISEEADDEAEEDETSDESGDDLTNLMTADCATGYLVPNTTLGNLLQTNAASLTYNIVISDNGEHSINESEQQRNFNDRKSNADSGIGTGENGGGSLDQSPEQEQSSSVLSDQYDENWENLKNIVEPPVISNKNDSGASTSSRYKENNGKRKLRKNHSSSSDDTLTSSSRSSSISSSPSSESRDISRRTKFKTTKNLLHRLFVCIAGVADQLQTNFAADLRQILKSVFLINCTQEENLVLNDEKKSKENPQDLFEFRASEENVIRQSNSNQGSIGSQQSICSAEEVNPESDDAVFDEEESENESSTINQLTSKKHHEKCLTSRSVSLNDDTSTTPSNENQSSRRVFSSSPSTSHSLQCQTESPPKWIPDSAASKCMACHMQFTAFRRRHHCRCCGQVFCGVCSSATTPLPRFGLTKPVRVCRTCYVREAST